MTRHLTIVLTIALSLTTLGRGQTPTLEEKVVQLEGKVGSIETRLDKAGIPKPAAEKPPAEKPSAPVKRTTSIKLAKGGQILVVGGELANVVIASEPYTNEAIVARDGATLENIAFASNTGYPLKVAGSDVVVRNLLATTFTGYALYAEGAKNLTVDGFHVKGGSDNESILRLDEASGTIRNFDIDYNTKSRKATMRGSFTGLIENGIAKGAPVGFNPLDNADGGELLGWVKFAGKFPGGTADAVNVDEVAKVIREAIARGVTDNVELCRIALTVARDAKGQPIAGMPEATMARRVTDLAKRSDVTWRNVTLENAPLRWAANTRYDYQGGKLIGETVFHQKDKPTSVYPRPQYVLPGDTVRTPPSITFTGTTFVAKQPVAEFLAEVKRYGVVLKGCTYNGQPIADVAVSLPRVLYNWQGAGQAVDVFTDTQIHQTELTAKDAYDVLPRVPPSMLAIILDAENAYEGERETKYAQVIKAVARYTGRPTSAYGNVTTHYYTFRDWQKNGTKVTAKDAERLVHRELLDASAHAVWHAYLIDDATEPWMDAAIVTQGDAVAAAVAPGKPSLCYVSPELYSADNFAPKGLVPMDRWKAFAKACGSVKRTRFVFYGFTGDHPAAAVQPYFDELAAAVSGASR